jgi:hypothetical protein
MASVKNISLFMLFLYYIMDVGNVYKIRLVFLLSIDYRYCNEKKLNLTEFGGE